MYLNWQLSYCLVEKINMTDILDLSELKSDLCCFRPGTSFSVYVNNDRDMSVKRNSKWRSPPSWIYFTCRFRLITCFRSQLFIYLPRFVNVPQPAAELLHFVEKNKYDGYRHLGFVGTKIDGTSPMPFSVSVSTSVQIRAIATELWAFNGIQNGGRRHLEFTSRAWTIFQPVISKHLAGVRLRG